MGTVVDDSPYQSFIDRMLGITLRLVKLHEGLPTAVRSGFIVQREERFFLLTAGHGVNDGVWYIETDAHRAGETVLLPLTSLFQLDRVELDKPNPNGTVDFAWCEFSPRVGLDGARVDLGYYRGPLNTRPHADGAYGFAAWNRVELEFHPNGNVLERKRSFEVEMAYEGDDEMGRHRFRLARSHQGHRYYQGASGAPIADHTGQIVSLVLAGNTNESVIWGLALSEYERVIALASK